MSLLRSEVIRVLGELDDLAVARIIATGASPEELEEAAWAIEREDQGGERERPPSSPTVAHLRVLLEQIFADDLSPPEPS